LLINESFRSFGDSRGKKEDPDVVKMTQSGVCVALKQQQQPAAAAQRHNGSEPIKKNYMSTPFFKHIKTLPKNLLFN
ncbi:Hypothetical protein FKW44_002442, partial [Caligus rogercresseyi]